MSKKVQNIGIAISWCIIFFGGSLLLAGFQRDIDDILYQRLKSVNMSADSIKMVMKLPRSLIQWEDDGVSCETYLDVEFGVDAAAIVHVDQKCFEKKILFNYSGLRRGK